MSEAIINATGLACPQPVMLAKKALDEHDDVVVLVDNTTALENVKRLAFNTGCSAQITENTGGFFKMHMKKQNGKSPSNQPTVSSCCNTGTQPASTDPSVFVIASDAMGRGRGKDELGAILMKAFIHTTTDLESKPDVMIFYNAGVKLVSEGSDALDDLKQLEEKGIKMLVCGTCVNYFNLTGKIAAGVISNMYDIADTLSRVRRIVRP